MAQTLPFVVIDTMTSTPFTGNATPVFILDHLGKWLPEQSMQLIARELNHSETAFLLRSNKTKNTYKIRWFTPHAEEPFCGHGVLAAAQALHTTYNDIMEFSFTTHTRIKASATILPNSTINTPNNENEKLTKISMRFPSSPVLPTVQFSDSVRSGFANALGIKEELILAIGQNSLMDIVIEVDPDLDFSAGNMSIDAVALLKASPIGTRSQVITSSWNLDDDVDFAKRVFAYGSEDPATGSTYCALVPYWGSKLGKSDLRAIQPSLRGGKANLEWERARGFVGIKADCVKTIDGHIIVPIVYNTVTKSKL